MSGRTPPNCIAPSRGGGTRRRAPGRRLTAVLGAAVLLAAVTACAPTSENADGAQGRDVPRIVELHTQLGVGYMREGKYDLAFDRLERALKLAPDYAPAHNAMALLYQLLNEPQKAETHFKRALELSPSDSAAHNNYGLFLCRMSRYEEAEQQFLRALENPLYAVPESAYTNAGLCMYSAGDRVSAETYLRKALEINPQVPMALLRMAELSLDKGVPLAARGYLQRYQAVAAHTAQSLWLGVRIERALEDGNAVASYSLLLKSTYPDSNETRLLLESELR